MDLDRPVLPRWHHPRQRHRAVPRQWHPRIREILQPHGRLRRRRSLRHRDVRRRRAGAHGRRAPDQRPRHVARPDGRTPAGAVPGTGRARRRRPRQATEGAMTLRIAMWSGPRNISTAMMRAWENRGDCAVSDEPLYAAYLAATGLDHPAREQVIAAGERDPGKVIEALTRGPAPGARPLWYQKHMSHHLLPGMAREWILALTNVLLIRDPAEVVAS